MNGLRVETHENRIAYSPGETIAGLVTWALEKTPERIEVRLMWYTQGKGDRDLEVADSVEFESPAQADAQIFKFVAPTSPYSFSGRLISLQWALEVVAGRGVEPVRLDIVIAPNSREIDLRVPMAGFTARETK